jgi:diguanylate cyclase (GGDEF)-like protein
MCSVQLVTRGHMDGAPPERRAALLRAYHLVEDLQTPAAATAREQVLAALAESIDAGWVEVTTALRYAQAVDAVTHSPAEALPACTRLVDDAESSGDLGLLAAALGMRAELAIRDGDVVGFGRDTSRGVVLLDEDGDPLARVSGMISVAVAYEALNLWELGDELYTRAEELLPLCEDPLLTPIIGLNRALTWFWWTAALLEIGDDDAAALVPQTGTVEPVALPDGWGRELEVSLLARLVLLGQGDDISLQVLAELGAEVEGHDWLPSTQAHLALAHAHLRAGRLQLAGAEGRAAQVLTRAQGTVYQQSFADWTVQLVEQAREPGHGVAARAYATGLARQRWEERLGRLATAREQVYHQRLRAEHEHLLRVTLEDALTGLGNRRAFDERLDYLRATLAVGAPVAMLVVDVDRFKPVNDVFGHEAGDEVLRRIGALVTSVLRPEDLAVRLGGDEFGAVITGAPADAVRARADAVGRLVDAEDWELIRPGLTVTVSVGAACGSGPDDLGMLYRRADEALYDAKADGRGLLRIAR